MDDKGPKVAKLYNGHRGARPRAVGANDSALTPLHACYEPRKAVPTDLYQAGYVFLYIHGV